MASTGVIPFFDYRPEYATLRAELEEALSRVFASGQLILGPEVRAFEEEVADYLGGRFAVGVNSGTDAIVLALRALGVGAGDQVLTVANAGVPPVAAVRAVGADPVFVDVREDTLLLDAAGLEEAAGPRTRAILAVHLYGQTVDLAPVLEFARRRGLAVVEDCAQAFGARYRERFAGTWGTIGCFSFYPTKVLGGYGDGGMCVTDDPVLAERIRMLRMYGYRQDRHAHIEGVNSRLDELQAAFLRVKLRHIDVAISQRRHLASVYREALGESRCRLVGRTPDSTHVHHLFVVRVDDRERFLDALRREGVTCAVHYPEPVHRMEAYRRQNFAQQSLPVTEAACQQVVSLPLYVGLDPGTVRRIAGAASRAA